jgi:DUF4097 and DUF4098 domain-containing protein YvlB
VGNHSFIHLLPATLAVVLLALPGAAHADDWLKTYTVTGKPAVHIQTNDGAVRVSTWDGKRIEARIETIGWRIDESEVRIIERQTGDRIDIEARVPSFRWTAFNRRSLRIEVRVPREADLNIHTGDGSVETENNIGIVDIRTGDGHVRVSRAKGDVRLSTGDGSIEATGVDGRLDASTGDGGVRVEGRFDSLNLKTNDGSIDARVLDGSRMSGNWSLRTGDGSVTLRLPENLQADLDVHTGDGRISTEFPVTASGKISRSELRGKLNGGGPLLAVRTGDGSIRILK